MSCFTRLYANFGHGFMHAHDHHRALVVVLGREPTFREVQDSWHLQGSRNIDLARQKAGGGERPEDWDRWDDNAKRLAVLVHLHGMSTGGKIFEGKRKDPTPAKTEELFRLWNGGVGPKDPPIDPPPVDPPDPKKPKVELSGEIRLTVDGVVRVFQLVEKT
ncbi:MAG TPA: hypothetical protein VFR31_16965 [Thermoanaerobaculia bacterium]|nr:hypothetical protein [Thermoanaerobaculia bacterium]